MTEIREWSTTAVSNSDPSPDGWPEGMDKAGVNNSARENMASVRKLIENFPWIQVVKVADSVSHGSDDQVLIANNDYTLIFTAGARIRIDDGTTKIERTILTSSFGTSTTLNLVVELPVVQAVPTSVEYHCGKNATAGYRNMGTGVGEVLTLLDLADGSQVDMGSGNGFDADLLDGNHVEAIVLASALVVTRNMMVNTEFRRWQEGFSFLSAADLTYVCDQWKALVESGNHDFTRSSTVTPGALYSIQVSHQTPNTRAGIYQFVEQGNCVVAVDDVVSLQFQVKGAGQAPDVIRYAIVEWTGTPDVITAQPITAWPVSEGTDPTLDSNFNIIASDEIILDGSWQSVELLNATVAANMKNIGVMIWVDDQDTIAGDGWNVSQIKLQIGPLGGIYEHPSVVDHNAELHRYWRKTFNSDTTPAHGIASSSAVTWNGASSDTALNIFFYPFGTEMITVPSLTYWNPGNASPAGSNFIRNIDNGVDYPILNQYITNKAAQGGVSTTSQNRTDTLQTHFTADARFF